MKYSWTKRGAHFFQTHRTVRKGMADAVLATPAGLGRPLCKQGA
jgi:hypothetical protein